MIANIHKIVFHCVLYFTCFFGRRYLELDMFRFIPFAVFFQTIEDIDGAKKLLKGE